MNKLSAAKSEFSDEDTCEDWVEPKIVQEEESKTEQPVLQQPQPKTKEEEVMLAFDKCP